ncbi:DUF7606 domain-containing protein [Neisseria iguanae]|uniref:ACP-like domain-containing protein n=1 Tax=Neisseria iguanae TaxID=90242 RepID=UPI003CCB8E1A
MVRRLRIPIPIGSRTKCQVGKQVSVRYKRGKATAPASAALKVNGKIFNMVYDNESNADDTVFSGQGFRWSVNKVTASNVYNPA